MDVDVEIGLQRKQSCRVVNGTVWMPTRWLFTAASVRILEMVASSPALGRD